MKTRLIAITKPVIDECETAEDLVAYCARVSNPANQSNKLTAAKLVRFLIDNNHWSPLEMVSLTIEIETTRDIGRQILRHRSFSFQEFSQRYAEALDFSEPREARLQDTKNRQNSIETQDDDLVDWWEGEQEVVTSSLNSLYKSALLRDIAKEQARVILPEGLTMSRMYMSGTLRSWVHYCNLRRGNGTQKEHAEIAEACWAIICEQFPSLHGLFDKDEYDHIVDALAYAMKKRLREKESEGFGGWNDKDDFSDEMLHDIMMVKAEQGDTVDLANYAAFQFWRDTNGQ